MTHPHERRDGLDVKSITDGLDDIKDTNFGLIGCGVGKSPHFGHITVLKNFAEILRRRTRRDLPMPCSRGSDRIGALGAMSMKQLLRGKTGGFAKLGK